MATAVVPAGPARVLFVAEAVTLAHVGRTVSLARGLAARGYAPIIAVDPRFAAICPTDEWQTEVIRSIPMAQFLEALANGSPLYDMPTLQAYVEEDLALLRRTQPAVVVGDFRLSLSVSARVLGIPYINITNAYWSPYARQEWHVPDLPWVPYMPAAVADLVFRSVRRIVFKTRARSMQALGRAYGVQGLGPDLLRTYTDGDITLYADMPELVPLFDAPATHRYLGPVAWAPDIALPDWWSDVDRSKGLIYVTLGSSGSAARLPDIVEGLARLGLPVVVATAGAPGPKTLPRGVHLAPYLPGDIVARHSALVVCNGGSPTSHQALTNGVPVLALPANLDQVLNSNYLKAAGVGDWLRPQAAAPRAIERLGAAMLGDRQLRQRAAAIAQRAQGYDSAAILASAIEALAGGEVSARSATMTSDAHDRAGGNFLIPRTSRPLTAL